MVFGMSGQLGWKRTKSKGTPRLGITKDQASREIYGAASMLTRHDLSLTRNEHVNKNYTEAAIDALLLKRIQMLK